MWGKQFESKHCKSQIDMNLTIVCKSTQKLLFISNFFDKIPKMVSKNQQIKIIYSYIMANFTRKSVPSTWWTRWRGCPVGRGSVWARGPGTRPRPPCDEWRAGTGCSSISPPDTCTQRKQWNVTHTTSATSSNNLYFCLHFPFLNDFINVLIIVCF